MIENNYDLKFNNKKINPESKNTFENIKNHKKFNFNEENLDKIISINNNIFLNNLDKKVSKNKSLKRYEYLHYYHHSKKQKLINKSLLSSSKKYKEEIKNCTFYPKILDNTPPKSQISNNNSAIYDRTKLWKSKISSKNNELKRQKKWNAKVYNFQPKINKNSSKIAYNANIRNQLKWIKDYKTPINCNKYSYLNDKKQINNSIKEFKLKLHNEIQNIKFN